ncbi:MAG TPA: cell division ATP-binding protein FtsE [Clostridiaceae bacterium]|nr:cell division ATP-binding protein FtsE [Clostridiaceae bacterium]
MAFIEFEHVSKTYSNGTLALHDVSFTIQEGEFLFLIGESGAGKSTVFKLLTREEDPTAGRILMKGTDLARVRQREIPFLRRRIGMIFQDFRLIDTMTVGENVALAMEIIGEAPKKIRQRVPLVLSVVGLRHKISHYPTELSGGERQRVSIARALINKPSLIVADEPTGDLDPVNGEAIMALLERINRENGTTVITCTHDRSIVDRMKKRVIEVCDGLLVRDDAAGLYVLESQRDSLPSYAACARNYEEQAEELRREMEGGSEALELLRQEDLGSARAGRMREAVRNSDFYERLNMAAQSRRSRTESEDDRPRIQTGRVPVIRPRKEDRR